jgi:CRP-like cAMP-binding protein
VGDATVATGFLAALDEPDRRAFRAGSTPRRYRRGAVLFNEGDRSDWVALLLTGRVKLSSFTQDGREAVIAIAGRGELLGELSAVDSEPRSATAIAVDAVDALVMRAEAFAQFLETRPKAAMLVLRTVSTRLRGSDRKRVEFGTYDTVSRVARTLLELAEQFGERVDGAVHIGLPLSQEELAGMTGSSREAVVKALRSLRDRGWIETGRRQIRLLDPAALSLRAR